jgi:CubicO group peptidase (beta-lactamase class C family)
MMRLVRRGFFSWTLILLAACQTGVGLVNARAGGRRQDAEAAKVDEIFAQFDKPGSPGCAVGVYREGELLYSKGYGEADLERGVPVTPATVFYIASTAKQFTAMSVWLLARQNKLSLDDDVRKYIPEMPAYGAPITIRHLLFHTSGLRDYTDLLELAGRRAEEVSTNADILDLTVRQKRLNFPTGTAHQYTNSNYVLLAEIVKRVSGQTLREFARVNIFDPLGMKSTQYVDDHTLIIRGRALGYAKAGGKYASAMSGAERVGPAGLYTTVEDLSRWDKNFYSGAVGGKELLEGMLTPGRLSDGKTLDYASGLMLGTYRGATAVRHSGHSIGYRSEFLRLPGLRFSVAALCNDESDARPERLAERVADVYLGDRLSKADAATSPPAAPEAKPVAVTTEQMAGALGDYWNPKTGEVRQMILRNGQPVYVIDSWSRARLTAVGPTQFRFGRNEITVAPSRGGRKVLALRWYDGRVETYEELRRVNLTPAQLAAYAGRFYSAELDAEYVLEAKDGGLLIKRKNQEDRRLLPTAADSFSEGSVRIRFQRDGRGRPSGLLFGEGDVSDLEFVPDCRHGARE